MANQTDDHKLFWAALTRAPHHGASSAQVARLRAYLHQQLVLNRVPDDDAGDVAGRLLDAIEQYEFARVGDLIGHNHTEIPWNVVSVVDPKGHVWHRVFGADRYDLAGEPNLHFPDGYDWISADDTYRVTTLGLLRFVPLGIIKVVRNPNEAD